MPPTIPVVDFREAQQMIESATGRPTVGEPDLAPGDERWLGDWASAEHGSEFVFVTGYPMVKRPFYTHPRPGEPTASNSFDLLFRGLERWVARLTGATNIREVTLFPRRPSAPHTLNTARTGCRLRVAAACSAHHSATGV